MLEAFKSSGETSTSDNGSDSKGTESASSKTKSKTAVRAIGRAAETAVQIEAPATKPDAKSESTLWQRLVRGELLDKDKDSKAEAPLLPSLAKPEAEPKTETKIETQIFAQKPERAEAAETLPDDELTPIEDDHSVQVMLGQHKEILQSDAEPEPMQLVFIQKVEEKLQERAAADPEQPMEPVETVVDAAEAETIALIQAEAAADEQEKIDPPVVAAPAGGSTSNGGSGSPGGPGAGTPGGPAHPHGSRGRRNPPGPGGPGGPLPPGGGRYYGPPLPGGPGPNYNGPPGSYVSAASALRNERIAAGRGLLVGGLVGYFYGRRKGRIKTEKKLLPVQRKLEKRIEGLHDLLYAKEQNIHKLTAEKAMAARIRPNAAPAERVVEPAVLQRSEIKRGRIAELPRQQTERLGRLLVEAPAAAAAPVITSEQLRPAQKGQTEKSPILPFDKRIESFTDAEVKVAAEKIIIDGASLKEMYDAKRVNERGMRRILAEFLKGGNVRAALNRELLEKELTYERDPKLRQVAVDSAGSVGGGASSGGQAGSMAAALGLAATVQSGSSPVSSKPSNQAAQPSLPLGPVPDSATLKALRNRQMASVTAATVAVGAAIIFLIVMMA